MEIVSQVIHAYAGIRNFLGIEGLATSPKIVMIQNKIKSICFIVFLLDAVTS